MKSLEERIESFKKRALEIHKDIDLSLIEYVDNRTKIKVIDKQYGVFEITPSNLLKGCRHPQHKYDKLLASRKLTQGEVIERFKEVHKDENLDYSEVHYINMHTKVKIISHDLRPDGTEYGEFWQEPIVHLKGCTHPDIKRDRLYQLMTLSTEEFLSNLSEVRKDLDNFDLSKINYQGRKKKIIVGCKKHGYFEITPDNFLKGKGCPKCNQSKLESSIRILLDENKIEYISQYSENLKRLKLDFYIPSVKLGIECQGEQHFKTVRYSKNWTDEDAYNAYLRRVELDKKKYELSKKNDIEIIYFINKNIIIDNNFYNDKIIISSTDELLKYINDRLILSSFKKLS